MVRGWGPWGPGRTRKSPAWAARGSGCRASGRRWLPLVAASEYQAGQLDRNPSGRERRCWAPYPAGPSAGPGPGLHHRTFIQGNRLPPRDVACRLGSSIVQTAFSKVWHSPLPSQKFGTQRPSRGLNSPDYFLLKHLKQRVPQSLLSMPMSPVSLRVRHSPRIEHSAPVSRAAAFAANRALAFCAERSPAHAQQPSHASRRVRRGRGGKV